MSNIEHVNFKDTAGDGIYFLISTRLVLPNRLLINVD